MLFDRLEISISIRFPSSENGRDVSRPLPDPRLFIYIAEKFAPAQQQARQHRKGSQEVNIKITDLPDVSSQKFWISEIAKIARWNRQKLDACLCTISSEPGGGGDLMATRATAEKGSDGAWRLTGDKQMGGRSGVTSFMMTVAVPGGETTPDIFLLDTRELPWDGSRGATLVRAWDGHGMKPY